jgi:hypothetical protein
MGLESLVIHDPFLLQSFKETAHVFRDLYRVSRTIPYHESRHDFLDGALTITEGQDIAARPVYPNHAFREEHNVWFGVAAPSATWCKVGLARLRWESHSQDSI